MAAPMRLLLLLAMATFLGEWLGRTFFPMAYTCVSASGEGLLGPVGERVRGRLAKVGDRCDPIPPGFSGLTHCSWGCLLLDAGPASVAGKSAAEKLKEGDMAVSSGQNNAAVR